MTIGSYLLYDGEPMKLLAMLYHIEHMTIASYLLYHSEPMM